MGAAHDDRWESALPADMARAAPQIYRGLRTEGAACVRDWIATRYKGDKSDTNQEWVEFWNIATEIDFAMKDVPLETQQAFLASNDGMEIKLQVGKCAAYGSHRRPRFGDTHAGSQTTRSFNGYRSDMAG